MPAVAQPIGVFDVKGQFGIEIGNDVIEPVRLLDVEQPFEQGLAAAGGIRQHHRLVDHPVHVDAGLHRIVSQADDVDVQP